MHQARVAIRRLRSAFRTFAPALSPAFIEVYAPRWGELARLLGGARDWDVFLARTLAPLEMAFPGDPDLARLRQRSETVQAEAQASAGVALTRRIYSYCWRLPRPCFVPNHQRSSLILEKVRICASLPCNVCVCKKSRDCRKPGSLSDMQRHRLRIAFKKLRYALSFCSGAAAQTPQNRTRKNSLIQDLLGKTQRSSHGGTIAQGITPDGRTDPLTSGWIAGRKHLLIEALNTELENFLSLRSPW